MANKLPWFTHDHDAHADGWIRHLVRNQGHVAGWTWWVLLELHHKHGVGDVLKRDINDVAKDCLTSASVVARVLTEMASEYEGEKKVKFNIVGTVLHLEIPKLRKRQAKLKSKIPPTLRECSANVPIEREVEREEEKHTPISPETDNFCFKKFWDVWPEKIGRADAEKAWAKLKPSEELIETILSAIKKQEAVRSELIALNKFCPRRKNPGPWINSRRWEDEIKEQGSEKPRLTMAQLLADK